MRHAWLGFGLLLLPCAVRAAYDYRYVEGEKYSATDGSGLREEGFTSWMRHPSNGAVMVLASTGWLEHDVKGLGEGEYHVFVRGLAWASGCEVDLLWDGQEVGRPVYPRPGTALKWSAEVGVVRGPGDHKLRTVADPKITQAPYIDVILLTTQPDYQPGDDDRDFASFTTDLPILHLHTQAGEETVQPEPGPAAEQADFTVTDVRAGPLGIGGNEVAVSVSGRRSARARLLVAAALGEAPEAEAEVALNNDQTGEGRVVCEATTPGQTKLRIRVVEGDEELAVGAYTVTVPNPVAVSLDEYAYPLGTQRALWRAAFTSRPEVTREVTIEIALRKPGARQPSETQQLRAADPSIEQALNIAGLPRGRYTVASRFLRAGQTMLEEERPFIVFDPAPLDAWEPVARTEARSDTVLLNGRPFLGRLLYHAAADERTRNQGFNLVQCYGGDPNPVESIQQHLDACAKVGLWGTVALFNNRYLAPGDHFDLDHIREVVERFRNHPAVWGWDLIDEPEVSMTPEKVAEAARLIRQLDPNHVVWVNLCQPDKATAYLESQDLWSFDSYPLPTLGPFAYLGWLKITDERLRGTKPLGSALQTYSSPGNRLPTPDELRCIAYLHLIHGHKWFGFYSYYDPEPAGCLARDPVLWSFTRALNGELRVLAPVILAAAPMRTVGADQGAEVFQAAEKAVSGKRYLFAVSGSKQPLAVSMKVAGTKARVLFEEERSVVVRGGLLKDEFGPYGVHVYVVE